MNIDWSQDNVFMVKEVVSKSMLMDLYDTENLWDRIKERLNQKFYYEVFSQMFDNNWHCLKLFYTQRDRFQDDFIEYAIVGKIISVTEKVNTIENYNLQLTKFVVDEEKNKFYLVCSHCGNLWTPTNKGACSSCGADARSALNMQISIKE